MSGELFTVFGETNGTSTTGIFSLTSDLLVSPVTSITIPRGTVAKIWAKRKSGKPLYVSVKYANDGQTFRDVERQELVAEGELDLEKRRPIVLRSFTGIEAFEIGWNQTEFGAGVSEVSFDIELGGYPDSEN